MPTLDLSNRLNSGTQVGRFIIDEWRASGGTADVYTCYADTDDESARKRYVAKVFRFDGEEKDYRRKRRLFEREAEVLEAVSGNIHVVTVFQKGHYFDDLEREHPRPFTVLQRLTGGSLADLICEKKYDEHSAARIAIGLLDALIYAHSVGFLHCDVKPDNVMLDESGNPVWIDFGISKEIDMPTGIVSVMSERGAVAVGTAPYMSPEHFLGRASLCPQSDVWSMGVLLMRMMTWLYPFGLHFEQVRQRTMVQTWKGFDDLPVFKGTETSPDLSPAMRAIIAKCLQVDLDERYESAASLRSDLEAFISGRPPALGKAAAAAPDEEPPKPEGASVERTGDTVIYNYGMSRRSALLAGTAAGLVIVILALIFASLLQQRTTADVTRGEEDLAAVDEETADAAPTGERETTRPDPDDAAALAPEADPPVDEQNRDAVRPETLAEIEGAGTPVTVMLYPNRGYRGERITVNGERISANVGLVRRFESRVGDLFEWEIMGTDGRVYRHRVQIPSDARQTRQVRINWQTGAVEPVIG